MKRFVELLKQLWTGRDGGRLVILLAVAAIVLAIVLLAGRKPWDAAFLEPEASLRAIITAWLWVAALFCLVVVGGLLATQQWWRRWSRLPSATPSEKPSQAVWFWSGCALAVLLLVVQAVPRKTQSLWNDEDYAIAHNVFGEYQDTDAGLKLERPSWQETIWRYPKPTNHIPQTVAARIALDVYRAVPGGSHFEEAVVRIPSLLFGVAGLFMLGLFVRTLLGGVAGATAAILIALHPWYIQFASEARGYSLALAALAGALWMLVLAYRSGSWSAWFGYGCFQLMALLAYPGFIYAVVPMNLVLVGSLVLGADRGFEIRRALLTRWFLTAVLSGLVFVMLFAPCLPQFYQYLGTEEMPRSMVDIRWLNDTGSYLLTGVKWHAWGREPGLPDLDRLLPESLALRVLLAGLLAVWWLLGARAIFRRSKFALALLAGMSLGAAVAVALASRSTTPFWEWYVCQLLLVVVSLTAAGAVGLGDLARDRPIHNRIATFSSIAVAICYGLWIWPVGQFMWSGPRMPIREAVVAMRGDVAPFEQGRSMQTIGFIEIARVYDPDQKIAKNVEDLQGILSDAEGGSVAAMIYARNESDPAYAEIFELLERKLGNQQRIEGRFPYDDILIYGSRETSD